MKFDRNISKLLYRLTFSAAALALACAMVTAAGAQSSPQVNDNDTTRAELYRFDRLLDNHPGLAAQLQKNPNLINDPQFISQHPVLENFLKTHPGVAEEIKENPQQFMIRERRFERSGADINRGEVRGFDQFLDKHPEIDEQLQKNPSLVNNPDYLAKHPELNEFLANHPQLRQELQENPRVFMARERRFDRREANATPRPRPRRPESGPHR